MPYNKCISDTTNLTANWRHRTIQATLLDHNLALHIGRHVRAQLADVGQEVEHAAVALGHPLQEVLVLTLDVALEGAGVAVALGAVWRAAPEGLGVLVREQVAVEVVLPLEALVALGAGVLALAAVDEAVLGQRALVREHLAAVGAALARTVRLMGG